MTDVIPAFRRRPSRAIGCALLLMALAGLPGAARAQGQGQGIDTGTYAARVEVHPFETLTLTDQQFLAGSAEAGRPTTLAGVLRIARPGTERLPTVVLMHGSGGIAGNIEFWQRELTARGISTFAIDGFTGRGLTSVNTDQALLGRTAFILDIYRALGVLAKHPRVDPKRVAVMGFSRGGQAALYASLKRFDTAWNRSGIAPAAFLPFYPDCSITFRSETEIAAAPVHIFAGGADDYNPAATCAAYVDRLKANGREVALTVYPGGWHVFDNPAGPKTPTVAAKAQSVRDCAIREEAEGRLVNAVSGAPFTYADPCVRTDPHIASDDAIRAAALKAVSEDLAAAFGPRR